jgi:hypothetical protein
LQEAKEHLAQGWCRRVLNRPTPSGQEVCALGALVAAAGSRRELMDAVTPAKRALLASMACSSSRHPDKQALISGHNDLCLKTQADALDWFDRAIRHAKDQEGAR